MGGSQVTLAGLGFENAARRLIMASDDLDDALDAPTEVLDTLKPYKNWFERLMPFGR